MLRHWPSAMMASRRTSATGSVRRGGEVLDDVGPGLPRERSDRGAAQRGGRVPERAAQERPLDPVRTGAHHLGGEEVGLRRRALSVSSARETVSASICLSTLAVDSLTRSLLSSRSPRRSGTAASRLTRAIASTAAARHVLVAIGEEPLELRGDLLQRESPDALAGEEPHARLRAEDADRERRRHLRPEREDAGLQRLAEERVAGRADQRAVERLEAQRTDHLQRRPMGLRASSAAATM